MEVAQDPSGGPVLRPKRDATFDLFVGIIFIVSTIMWAVKFVIMVSEKIESLRCYKA